MKLTIRKAMLVATAIAAAMPAIATGQTQAQAAVGGSDQPPTAGAGLAQTPPRTQDPTATGSSEDIVVTAQKRNERLLDVPVSVTAVSADSLISQNIVTLRDFSTRVPGLSISGNTTQDISVRGINAGGGTNPTVAILIDDVQFGSSTYLGRPPIPSLDPAILQQVEVLRGPQGTLYGASSLGGLVKFVTKDPSTTAWSGEAQVGGNTVAHGGQGWSTRAAINAPVIDDHVGVSLSGFYRRDPQYIDAILPSGARVADANFSRAWGGRAAVLLKPVDRVSLTVSALVQDTATRGPTSVLICPSCSVAAGQVSTVTYAPRGASTDTNTAPGAIVPTTTRAELYTGRGVIDLGFAQFVSVTAWGRSNQSSTTDSTTRFGPPLLENAAFGPIYPAGGVYLFTQPIITNKFSQEVRLTGTGRLFDWIVGGFLTTEHSLIQQRIDRVGTPSPVVYNGNNISSYKERAVFADATVHLLDRLDVQVGGRYAHNDQVYNVRSTIDTPAQVVFGPGENSVFTSGEDAFTWLVTPTFHINPDLMVYARFASGYRPGGPNTQTPGAASTFGHDSVVNYELGAKGSLLDRRLTFDAALFQIDWDAIQLQNTALPSQFVFFENGKNARSRGLEFATTVRPWKGMSLNANGSIQDAVLTQSLDPSTAAVQRLLGPAGSRLPYSTKFSGNLGANQEFAVSEAVVASLGFNANYVGTRYGLFNQNAALARIARPRLPGYTLFDLFGTVSLDRRWEVNVYVRNLFDKVAPITVTSNNGTQLPQALFTTPRTAGVNLSVRF